MAGDAATIFLWVAAFCAVFLTLLVAAAAAALLWAAIEVRALARNLQKEAQWYIERRRAVVRQARFAGKWVRIFGGRLGDQFIR